MTRRTNWAVLIAANVLFYCVLSFYQTSSAAPQPTRLPFANAVEQRIETVKLLNEIKELLKEQNALLRSGNLQVVVSEPNKR